jgi:hypothetical protein
MKRLHSLFNQSYGKMLDILLDYCMSGNVRSFPLFGKVFANYMASWDAPENYDAPLISGILNGRISRDIVHYQALMKIITDNLDSAKALVSELAQELFKDLEGGPSPPFYDWVKYQQLLVQSMSLAVKHDSVTVSADLNRAALAEYMGENVADDGENTTLQLELRPEYREAPFDVFVLRISYGSVDTLRLLQYPASTSTGTAALQEVG